MQNAPFNYNFFSNLALKADIKEATVPQHIYHTSRLIFFLLPTLKPIIGYYLQGYNHQNKIDRMDCLTK